MPREGVGQLSGGSGIERLFSFSPSPHRVDGSDDSDWAGAVGAWGGNGNSGCDCESLLLLILKCGSGEASMGMLDAGTASAADEAATSAVGVSGAGQLSGGSCGGASELHPATANADAAALETDTIPAFGVCSGVNAPQGRGSMDSDGVAGERRAASNERPGPLLPLRDSRPLPLPLPLPRSSEEGVMGRGANGDVQGTKAWQWAAEAGAGGAGPALRRLLLPSSMSFAGCTRLNSSVCWCRVCTCA